ncbi:hypothetical protein ABEB36_003990 [Hypothenemus hampei]|uniref:Uncharacterized protein n=1 Tax=Hypothenemus hampei TaxID=57062 RepID=A0ABD1F1U1_HYPHA
MHVEKMDPPLFYPEDSNCSIYYENELRNLETPRFQTTSLDLSSARKSTVIQPTTIKYLNERKCPIYVHHIRNNSSVYNHYNAKLTHKSINNYSIKKPVTKVVLDKLEETYWATWKPTKEIGPTSDNSRTKNRVKTRNVEFKPVFFEHKGEKQNNNTPHGDSNDSVVKYFKAKRFDSSSTTESTFKVLPEKIHVLNQESQEIHKKFHCPVILQEEVKVEEDTLHKFMENLAESLANASPEKPMKPKTKKSKKNIQQQHEEITESKEEPIDNTNLGSETFVDHKDSIEITKKKQEKSGSKEHFQKPKCIRLYRKSGSSGAYIKGGTYPLKSCLKKDELGKGNFRLGPPGRPLFLTNSSFSNKKRI